MGYVEGSLWFYQPNKVAPIVFCILYLFSGLWHAYQTIRYKAWKTTLLLPWAAALMIAGFVVRELGAYDIGNLGYLIASTVLIMSGPPVYALVNYFTLSRLLWYIPYLSPIHPGRIATTFTGLDGICEILIGQGASRMANSSLSAHDRQVGATLVKVSLILQCGCFFAFGILAGYFHYRAARAGVLTKQLRTVLLVLYCSSAIVTVRCIYRIVEFFEGWTGYVYTHEAFFWVFEASIMFANSFLLNLFNPGKRLPSDNCVFLDRDGVTERRGPGWDDERPWLITMFDPFDLIGACRGKDNETRFWDMTDEQLEQAIAEKKQKKRTWWAALTDPFHLWGSRGLIGKRFSSSRGEVRVASGKENALSTKNPEKSEASRSVDLV